MHIRINNNLGSLPVRRRAVVLFEDGREREEEEEEDGGEREKRRREDGTGVTEGGGTDRENSIPWSILQPVCRITAGTRFR